MKAHPGWSPFRAWRAGGSKFWPWQDILLMAIILFFGIWLWRRASHLPAYEWNWKLLGEFIVLKTDSGYEPGLLLKGLFTTLRIGCWTVLFSFILGGLIGSIPTRAPIYITAPCRIFINIIRNTPPLVILFCVYFFAGNFLPIAELENYIRNLPDFIGGFIGCIFASTGQMDRMTAAILALGLYQGVYVAEIMRGGIDTVAKGQWEAAMALGFSRGQCLRLVIFPQAARIILPPLTGQVITTFKDSALASLISLPDLTFQSLEIMAVSYMTFEIWISCALLYLLIGAVCAFAGDRLEKKFTYYH